MSGTLRSCEAAACSRVAALTTQWHSKMTMPYLSWLIFITFYAFISNVLLSFMVSSFLYVSYYTADYSYLYLLKSSNTGILDVLIWPATMVFSPLFFYNLFSPCFPSFLFVISLSASTRDCILGMIQLEAEGKEQHAKAALELQNAPDNLSLMRPPKEGEQQCNQTGFKFTSHTLLITKKAFRNDKFLIL